MVESPIPPYQFGQTTIRRHGKEEEEEGGGKGEEKQEAKEEKDDGTIQRAYGERTMPMTALALSRPFSL